MKGLEGWRKCKKMHFSFFIKPALKRSEVKPKNDRILEITPKLYFL